MNPNLTVHTSAVKKYARIHFLSLLLLAVCAGCVSRADSDYDAIVALIDAGRYSEAIASASKAIERHPRDPRFYYERGYCTLKTDVESARKDFEESMKIDPDYANAYYGMSIIYRKDKKYDLAEEHIMKAISLADDKERKSAYYGGLAMLYGNKRQFKQAIMFCKKSIALDDKGEYYYRLGIFLYNDGQKKEAVDTWLSSIRTKEYRQVEFKHLTYGELANYYYRAGDYIKAKENIDKAIELDPANEGYAALLAKMKNYK